MAVATKPAGTYRGDAQWNGRLTVVEFALDVHTDDGHQEFMCRVSQEALADMARQQGSLSGDEAVQIYGGHKERIHAVINRKLLAGEFGDDRVILVRTLDLNRGQ